MKRFGKIASLLAAVALFASVGFAAQPQGQQATPQSLEGKAAPDFALKTLDGKDVKLSDQKGKVVLIDFWATWCPPCRESLPHLEKTATDTTLAEKGLVVWAVNARETKDKIEPFMKENKYTFSVPMDTDGAAMGKYHVRGIPTTVIVGRDGKVKKVFVGFSNQSGTADQIHKAVEAALAEESPTA